MENNNKTEEKKQHALKNNFTERKHSMRCYQRNGWIDFSELWAIDSLHNEGTNFSNGWFRMKRMVCRAWAQEQAPLNSHWLVLTNSGADFYDCWPVDSI